MATPYFEATHGTAPKYADKDVINPGSVILSGVMMFRFMGWTEAADLIERGMERTIEQKKVTYDFERLMDGRNQGDSTSQFATTSSRTWTRGAESQTQRTAARPVSFVYLRVLCG